MCVYAGVEGDVTKEWRLRYWTDSRGPPVTGTTSYGKMEEVDPSDGRESDPPVSQVETIYSTNN